MKACMSGGNLAPVICWFKENLDWVVFCFRGFGCIWCKELDLVWICLFHGFG